MPDVPQSTNCTSIRTDLSGKTRSGSHEKADCVGSSAKGGSVMSIPRQSRPSEDDAQGRRLDLTQLNDADKAAPNGDRGVNESASIRDVWWVLDRARLEPAPRTLAAAQDAVFQRYLPLARSLAGQINPDLRVDPAAAEQAAEIGLAQAVLGWRRPDGSGFETFAQVAIAAQLGRLPTSRPPKSAGPPPPPRQTDPSS